MIGELEHSVAARWARAGVLLNVAPARQTPDLERLILDTAECIPSSPRLFSLAASWLTRYCRLVARHRLARMTAGTGDPHALAVLGLLLDTVRKESGTESLDAEIACCRPAPRGMPLFGVDRSSPALAERIRKRASRLSRRWNLWADPVEWRWDVIRPVAWVLQRNPSFRTRAIFHGGLRASVLACLEHDRPGGASEAELARLCGVTRKAVHEAVDHLEFCGLAARRRAGRCYAVTQSLPPLRSAG